MAYQKRQWTNPSVIAFAQGADPVSAIQGKLKLGRPWWKLRKEVGRTHRKNLSSWPSCSKSAFFRMTR